MKRDGLEFAWRLLESDRVLLNYSGTRILLFILYKYEKNSLITLGFDFQKVFEKFKLLLNNLSKSDRLSHFLELLQDLIRALPPSLETLSLGLTFLESLWDADFGASNAEIILKTCSMMVDLFSETNFRESPVEVVFRFSKYIIKILHHYEETKDLVILDSCFFQLIACFLFKMELFLGLLIFFLYPVLESDKFIRLVYAS